MPEPADGQALVAVRHLSIDPTIRTWMDDAPGYLPPIGIGDVVRSGGIGEVVASRTDALPVGDTVFGMLGLAGVRAGRRRRRRDDGRPRRASTPPVVLGVLGVTGMTAYFGLLDIGRPRAGDTVVVSGAAGATGSVVGQLARIAGAATVVGIAGTDDKCAWLVDELGFDHAVNYRTEDVGAGSGPRAPTASTSSSTTSAATSWTPPWPIWPCTPGWSCAERSPSTTRTAPWAANYLQLIVKRSRMEGFLILDYLDRFPEAQLEMAGWVMEGRIQHREHVVEGLEHAGEALNLLFSGGNTGKVVVAV